MYLEIVVDVVIFRFILININDIQVRKQQITKNKQCNRQTHSETITFGNKSLAEIYVLFTYLQQTYEQHFPFQPTDFT